MPAYGLSTPGATLTSHDESTFSTAALSRVVYVAVCAERQGCRFFQCPRRAEVIVKYDFETPDDPTRDWFWCLGHWPRLLELMHDRGHRIEYSAEALVLVAAVKRDSGCHAAGVGDPQ